jgi:hypothetical protein
MLVEVRVIVSATAAGIMVGTPVESIGTEVGVLVVDVFEGIAEGSDEGLPEGRILGGLELEGSGEGRPKMEGTEEDSEEVASGKEDDKTTGTVDGINDGGSKASA